MGPGMDNHTSVSPQDSSPKRESKYGTVFFFPKMGALEEEKKTIILQVVIDSFNHVKHGEEAAIVSELDLSCALWIVTVVSSENDFQSGKSV